MDALLNPVLIITIAFAIGFTVCFLKIMNPGLPGKKRRYHPVVGTIFSLLFNFHRLHDYMADLASKYKTYRLLNFFQRDLIYTADPANVEYILKTNFPNYGKVTP